MSRQGTGARVAVRIYMEGIHVPNGFVNLSCSGGRNQPASCQLEMVPTNTIRHIMPGTWIHIFVTDPWDQDAKGDLSDFKLLFEGVVIGRGFVRQDDGRNFTIRCAAPEVYWAQAKQYWMNIGSANGDIVDQLAVQTSGGFGRFGKVSTTGTFGYMISKLAFSRKNQEQAEERFLDTLISVLDDIGNVNPYYTNIRNRFRITDRIVRAPAGKTEKLFQLALLSDFLDGVSGRQSGQTNMVDVVNQLLTPIMHEWVSILAPSYIETRIFDRDVFGNIKRNKKTVRRRGPRGRTKVDLLDFEPAIDKVVASVMFKPHVYTIDPPSFNTLFPNMYDQMSYEEDFLGETTRLSMRPQLPLISNKVTQGMLIQRPVELEVFTSLVRDPKRRTSQKRTPDGKYADGESQAPTFTEYDWTTNEERIRGIVFNFQNLAPAPSTLTLTDPGARQPDGTRKGGIPKYLQNVASYEYYKSKFMARQSSLQGPFNMRPVPGFPMTVLDDSESQLNLICYLDNIQHNIDAQGSAMTRYTISYPRILGEVDYNRPRFTKGFNADGQLDLSLFRDEEGGFDFASIFEGENQPPVPEWFDESFRNTRDLDVTYRKWFGEDAGVLQNRLFENEGEGTLQAVIDAAVETFNIEGIEDSLLDKTFASIGAAAEAFKEKAKEFEELLEKNENIPIAEAVEALNDKYRIARGVSKEFEEAADFTKRSFTKIDEAFAFVGASPREFADRISADDSEKDRIATFETNPTAGRVIDYKTARLDNFVGDTSAGSGFSGKAEGDTFEFDLGGEDEDLAAPTEQALQRMSGAFPLFDTRIHTGTETSDQKVRNAVAREERGKSDRARYDGRPLMFDFEFRLWQQSLFEAGLTPSEEEIAENAELGDYTVQDGPGNIVRPRTPSEQAAATIARRENLETKRQRREARRKRTGHDPAPSKCPNMPPNKAAPTGDGLEQGEKLPLPQPLSEKQVVDLRRSVVEAYNEELGRTRGFTG